MTHPEKEKVRSSPVIHDENLLSIELYFDCVEQADDHQQQLLELTPICQQPWISEIWLSVHRK